VRICDNDDTDVRLLMVRGGVFCRGLDEANNYTTIPVVKTADREEITNKMQPDNVISENVLVKSKELSLEELRLLSRKRKCAESDRRRAQAVNDTFHESIPTLTLDMCRDPSISLTQVVLRAYCKSAGLN
jgi:hypothetical protein